MAAGNGQFEIVKYLFDRSLEMNSEVQDGAASGRYPLLTDRAIKHAAERGHFELVKWMHDKIRHLQQEQDFVGILADPYTSVDKAIEFGSLEMVESIDPISVPKTLSSKQPQTEASSWSSFSIGPTPKNSRPSGAKSCSDWSS